MFQDLYVEGQGKLTLRYWDDPILSKVATPFKDEEFGKEVEELGLHMLALMASANGLGLSANQVGCDRQIFVMKYPEDDNVMPLVICNPELSVLGRQLPHQEGCLSVPGIYDQVMRYENCFIKFRKPDGQRAEVTFPAWPLASRCAQHEFDHLNGIMFFDRQRMPKNVSKHVLRRWDKVKHKYGR